MKHLHVPAAAALLLLCAAAPAPAQQQQPPADPAEPIVVTGTPAVEALVVDVERIARRCIACRRAVQRLRAAAARNRTAPARDPTDPDERGFQQRDEFGSEVGLGLALGADAHRRSLRTQQAANRRAGQAIDRVDAALGADRMIENLLRAIEPIVERHRLERRAEAVYGAGDPAVRGRDLPDISDSVIEELDRDYRGLDLLAGAAR